MSKQKIAQVGKATEEQISAWKKEYGADRIQELEIAVSNKEISYCYVRKPNRTHISRAMSFVLDKQPIEAGESLLDDTWLGGDPRCKSIEDPDTEFRVGAAWAMYENTKILSANIKNV